MGMGIGATGLHTVDLDGDGKLEVVAAAGPRDFFANSFWYVLSKEAAPGVWMTRRAPWWSRCNVGGQVNGLAVRELTGDGVDDLVFAVQ
ncbi:MAG TPA: hypothetical protein VEU33_14865 [Archangium sp.]|nr:hypothetical protein [Archangium sp.]